MRAYCFTASCTTCCEVLVVPVAAGEADEREPGRQQPAVGEVVDRRHELLARQVAGHAEDDEARSGPAMRLSRRSSGDAQRVVLARDLGRWHADRSSGLSRRASSSVATFAAGSVSVRVSTGRPWSASTLASPAACAAMSCAEGERAVGDREVVVGALE